MKPGSTIYLKKEIIRLDEKIAEAKKALNDPQLKTLAEDEINGLQIQKKILKQSLQTANQSSLVNQSFKPDGNVILEIRPAAGGEEAKIWASDLETMYTRFANIQQLTVINLAGGIIKIKGKHAYPFFLYEAGVHRVQRIPTTESQGRIHTSTATVTVLKEVKETEIKINPKDIEVKFYHSSSQGGQNVQKVSTAVRLTHKPSGIITTCQTQRYQEQNRKIAFDLLRSKLYHLQQEQLQTQTDKTRSQAVGQGMRAEKIRTYNYPQNRVTDHRLNKSWKNLNKIIEGNLLPVIKALQNHLK